MKTSAISTFVLVIATAFVLFEPSLGHQVTRLDQGWQFGKSNADTVAAARPSLTETVNLPYTWNAKDIESGDTFYQGGGWFEKTIQIPSGATSKHEFFLKFWGACSVAEVYVNDKFAGEHKGGFSAFCFDVTKLLKSGSNTIDVRVDNTPRPDVIPINTHLFALFGGLYRHVDLIETPKTCISPLDFGSSGVFVREPSVTSQAAQLKVGIDLQNSGNNYNPCSVLVTLKDQQGRVVADGKMNINLQSGPIVPIEVQLLVKHPHLWQGRLEPYLYKVLVRVENGQKETDQVDQAIGIRRFSIIPGHGFELNGKPYRLYGVCRHQDKQDEGTALSDAEQVEDADMIDEIGATAVRLAHYQESDAIYSAFDRNGIVVWAESPFVNASSGKESENALQQYKELILQNFNHASIAFWGSSNEVYGKTPESYVPTLIRKLALEAKELDPGRFSAATSGAGNPFGPEVGYAEVQGMNRYYGWYYGKINDLETWFEHMKKVRPGLQYALTEYGAEANLAQESELTPETINGTGAVFPESYQTMLHEKSWLIIKAHPECIASFVWNMFDFTVPGWDRGGMGARNMKGLVSYDRKTKKDAFYWYKANWNPAPLLHLVGRRAVHRTIAATHIEVFSNVGKPQIELNGVLVKVVPGVSNFDWIATGVHLKSGENTITASVSRGGSKLSDKMVWNLVAKA